MKKCSKTSLIRLSALALALVLVVSAVAFIPSHAANTSDLGALTDSFTSNNSSFTLSESSRLYIVTTTAPSENLVDVVQLAQQQFAADSLPTANVMPIVWGDTSKSAAGDILIYLDSACGLAADGYQLVLDGTASVTASNVRGILYGLNTLQKHFRAAEALVLQGFTCIDEPDTVERTVSLDFARKYYSKEWICNFIREMSWMGYNTIQLHLSEDSGFRMDIWEESIYTDGFRPKNDFSWICGSENAFYLYMLSPGGTVVTDQHKDKCLTAAEMVEILQTAKQYQMDVIPSFDSPGHVDYLTWKYEQNYLNDESYSFISSHFTNSKATDSYESEYEFKASEINGIINYTGVSDEAQPNRAKPYFKAFNVNNEQAKAFFYELYTDIANFFKVYAGSTDFSICADEVLLTSPVWVHSLGKSINVSYLFDYDDFVDYINGLNRFLNGMGYTTRMYNDYMGTEISNFDSNIEIMYWASSFDPQTGADANNDDTTTNDQAKPTDFAKAGRLLYNCIQTHTYFAQSYSSLTSDHPDCRCPNNRYWTMSNGTEELIYTQWVPNDFAEQQVYRESGAALTGDYLDNVAGAYFLIWSDNPMLSTEAELWNGFTSNCTSTCKLEVNLLNRMWSNTIKMWNWDINSSLTFANFETLREGMGYFPGFTSCSAAASFPAATEPVCLSERAALQAAVSGGKLDSTVYTADSYAPYSTAYDAAVAALASGTDVDISNALAALLEAKKNLVIKNFEITVTYKNKESGNTVGDKFTQKTPDGSNEFEIYLPRLSGYNYVSADGASFSFSPSGDGSAFLRGAVSANTTVTVWLTPSRDDSRLQTLIEEAITSQTITTGVSYTQDSWDAYNAALGDAKKPEETSTQVAVDAVIARLEKARNELVVDASAASSVTLSVELLNESVPAGKQIAFYVTSSAAVANLTVKKGDTTIEPLLTTAEVQVLNSGTVVKMWLITVNAEKTAENPIGYTISYVTTSDGTTEETVEETVYVTVS